MQQTAACRHTMHEASPDLSAAEPAVGIDHVSFTLVSDSALQEVTATASRRLRHAGDFRAAVRFMVGAGFHPRAGETTVRLADALAARMYRSRHGHIPLSADATARKLGLSRRTVLYHARYLRELGLLAYVEHGSRANAVRARRGTNWTSSDGYRPTATLLAPTAPPVWDHALGRRIEGTGYDARVVAMTLRGRAIAIHKARAAAKTRSRCTPSVGVPPHRGKMQVEGGIKDTAHPRRTTPAHHSHGSPNGPGRMTPAQCANAIAITQQVQLEVWWLHQCGSRRLAYALRPLLQAGCAAPDLTAELLTWSVPARLQDPAAYVHHELARRRRLGYLLDRGVTALGMPDEVVDDHGKRHAQMLHDRQQQHQAAWGRYRDQLRPTLRKQLTALKDAAAASVPGKVRLPRIREKEEDFLRTLSPTVQDPAGARAIYRAQAYGVRPSMPRTDHVQSSHAGWLERLRDEYEAHRACAALRAELDAWDARRTE